MKSQTYIIESGKTGSDRLEILANATWEFSKRFLESSGLAPQMKVLDIGCGNGEIARRYSSELMAQKGSITGIDKDLVSIQIAKEKFKSLGITHAFHQMDLQESDLTQLGKFDFIYCRLIISHLKDAKRFLAFLPTLLNEGGILAIEDIDFDGHVSHPECRAFADYVELYKKLAFSNGANPLIGRELALMLKEKVHIFHQLCICPFFLKGDGKKMAITTLELIQSRLLDSNLINENDLERMKFQLREFTENPETMLSLPRIFQIAGRS